MCKKYRPPNGIEGECFQSEWCYNCWYNHLNSCQVLMMTTVYDIDDPEYPVEWIYNEQGKPVCTKFLTYAEHNKEREHSSRKKVNQMELFV